MSLLLSDCMVYNDPNKISSVHLELSLSSVNQKQTAFYVHYFYGIEWCVHRVFCESNYLLIDSFEFRRVQNIKAKG